MEEKDPIRIVVLGKPGSGCSSLANTILGEKYFQTNSYSVSKAGFSLSKTKYVHNRHLTVIDISGLFLPGVSEEDKEASTLSCIAECAPGVNAFLVVLKVEKFTEAEDAIIEQICQLFPGDALKHAAVVFTRGDQLPDGVTIRDFVDESKGLTEWVGKCGGRCHVLDNKYWNRDQRDKYRSNEFHVAALLKSIDGIVAAHGGRRYTNKKLQEMERDIKGEERAMTPPAEMSKNEIREEAKRRVINRRMKRFRCWRLFVRCLKAGFVVAVVGAILSVYRKGWSLLEQTKTLE